MKETIAEYLKLASRLGMGKGSRIMLTKTFSSQKSFSVRLYNGRETIIRRGTSDWKVFKQVFVWREYDYPYPFNASCIIDAGANVGYASIWFANRFTGAKIVALEPETSNFLVLKENTGAYKNISCLNGGVWNKSCNLQIKDSTVENWSFRTIEVKEPVEKSIKAYNVHDIMKMHAFDKVDILKMDVEGAEKIIFGSNFESWLPLVKCLIIELHDNYEKGSSRTFFKVISNYNFSFDVLGENLFFFNNDL